MRRTPEPWPPDSRALRPSSGSVHPVSSPGAKIHSIVWQSCSNRYIFSALGIAFASSTLSLLAFCIHALRFDLLGR